MFLANKLNKGAGSPAALDAQFNYVTMLLHGDGTNGAQNNTFLDSSSNNFTITRNGNTTQGSFSPYGSNWSNSFNGTSSYLTLSSNASMSFGTSNFTIEGWFFTGDKSISGGASRTLIGNSGNSYTEQLYISTSGYLTFGNTGSTYIQGSTDLANNTWHHFAVSRSGTSTNQIAMWVDGTRVAQGTNSQNYTSGTIYIGAFGTTDGFWNGYISNLRIVNGSAVYDPANSTITVPTTPLTAITNTALLTCQANRFIDASANAYTVTATGSPSVQRFNPFGASAAYSTSVIGGSGYFDGTGDYLSVPDNASLEGFSDFTIEGWVYVSDFTSGDTIAAKGWTPGGYAPWMLYFTSTDLTFYASSTLSSWNIAIGDVIISNIQKNAWYHFAVSRSGSSLRLFSNGVLTTTVSNSTALGTNSGALTIGASLSGDRDPAMYLSDFRVNTTALYTAAFTPPTSPLTAVSNTSLLCNMTNGAIFDNAMMVDLETAGNAQISTSVKKYGTGSLAFDGTGDYLQYPFTQLIPNGTESFTIECWVNVTANKNYNFIFSAGYPVQIYISSSGIIGTAFNDADNSTSYFGVMYSTTAVTTGTWYHVAVTRSGSNFYLFVNGVLEGTASSSNAIFLSTTYKPTVADALNTGTSAYCFNGYIDDLRITKGYARYTANFTPPTAAFPNIGPV